MSSLCAYTANGLFLRLTSDNLLFIGLNRYRGGKAVEVC